VRIERRWAVFRLPRNGSSKLGKSRCSCKPLAVFGFVADFGTSVKICQMASSFRDTNFGRVVNVIKIWFILLRGTKLNGSWQMWLFILVPHRHQAVVVNDPIAHCPSLSRFFEYPAKPPYFYKTMAGQAMHSPLDLST
jgi:hypothetical protein